MQPLSAEATATEVQKWLVYQRFSNYTRIFQHFSGRESAFISFLVSSSLSLSFFSYSLSLLLMVVVTVIIVVTLHLVCSCYQSYCPIDVIILIKSP